jgi:hypothetical protein
MSPRARSRSLPHAHSRSFLFMHASSTTLHWHSRPCSLPVRPPRTPSNTCACRCDRSVGTTVSAPLDTHVPPKLTHRTHQDPAVRRHRPPEPILAQNTTPPLQTPRVFLAHIKGHMPSAPDRSLPFAPSKLPHAVQELAELSGSPSPERELVFVGDQGGRGEGCHRRVLSSPSTILSGNRSFLPT